MRRVIGAVMMCMAAAMLTGLLGCQWAAQSAQHGQAVTHETGVSGLTAAETAHQWEAATAYNRRLAGGPAPSGSDDGADDADYLNQLNRPADGIMSVIDYPSLGISLPVRHGSSPETLAAGAGHLYGSSLPVGGDGTRTVITAHRGGVDKLMFTRLGEAGTGDVFYLTTLGRTLAYRVTDIRVVEPSDAASLEPQAGRDLATLLTCTPYGVNTHRLLVTGERAAMPNAAPYEKDAPATRLPYLLAATCAALWLAVIIRIIKLWRQYETHRNGRLRGTGTGRADGHGDRHGSRNRHNGRAREAIRDGHRARP